MYTASQIAGPSAIEAILTNGTVMPHTDADALVLGDWTLVMDGDLDEDTAWWTLYRGGALVAEYDPQNDGYYPARAL